MSIQEGTETGWHGRGEVGKGGSGVEAWSLQDLGDTKNLDFDLVILMTDVRPQNCEKINFCCFKPQACDYLLQQQ
jgi:hypothetical protein